MNSSSDLGNIGDKQSTSETLEEAKNLGHKSPGVDLSKSIHETQEQREGDAGYIAPTSPESTTENVEITKAAFSPSGTQPANQGQTGSPAETETTDYGQTDTNYQQTDTPRS